MPLSSQGKAWIEVFDSDVACIIDVLCLGEMGRSCESRSHNRAFRMLINVSMTMVVAPLTFLWDGRWQDPSSVPGGCCSSSFSFPFLATRCVACCALVEAPIPYQWTFVPWMHWPFARAKSLRRSFLVAAEQAWTFCMPYTSCLCWTTP